MESLSRKIGISKYTLYIILVLIICCIAWFFQQKNLKNNVIEHAFLSNGTFDKHAEKALESIDSMNKPSQKDHFLAARIIDLNAHEGRINNVHVLNDVVNHYMTNLEPVQNDDLDWFEIDQIENFANRHMDIMNANPNYNNFIDRVLQKRPEKVKFTIEEAKDNAETKKEAFEDYVDKTIVHTKDSQNVHDSAVNTQMRLSIDKLRKSTPSIYNDKNLEIDIRNFVNNVDLDGKKKKKVSHSLETVLKNNFNGTLSIGESELLKLVWTRSEMIENEKNKELIKTAVLESLADMCDDDENLVCPGGRCARLIESLVHVDTNPNIVSGAMTVEQIRNDAFTQCNELLTETIKEQQGNILDKGLSNAAKSYEDSSIEVSNEDETRFKAIVKDKIQKFLQKTYETKLSTRDYNNLKTHCITTIESI